MTFPILVTIIKVSIRQHDYSDRMSAYFQGYRIERDQLWGLVDVLREYYLRESPLMIAIEELRKEAIKLDDLDRRLELSTRAFERLQEQHGEQLEVELQLFSDGPEHWVFRVLEADDQFRENFRLQDWPVEPVFYDDSDPGLTDPELLPLVERVDAEIHSRHYLITPILTIQDATLRLYDYDQDEQ